MNRDTAYIGSNTSRHQVRTVPVKMMEGDIKTLTVDASAYCGIEDTLIDSVSWSIESGTGTLGLGDATTTSKVTSLLGTANEWGNSEVKCAVTFDNGEVLLVVFRVMVEEPIPPTYDRYH